MSHFSFVTASMHQFDLSRDVVMRSRRTNTIGRSSFFFIFS